MTIRVQTSLSFNLIMPYQLLINNRVIEHRNERHINEWYIHSIIQHKNHF